MGLLDKIIVIIFIIMIIVGIGYYVYKSGILPIDTTFNEEEPPPPPEGEESGDVEEGPPAFPE